MVDDSVEWRDVTAVGVADTDTTAHNLRRNTSSPFNHSLESAAHAVRITRHIYSEFRARNISHR